MSLNTSRSILVLALLVGASTAAFAAKSKIEVGIGWAWVISWFVLFFGIFVFFVYLARVMSAIGRDIGGVKDNLALVLENIRRDSPPSSER